MGVWESIAGGDNQVGFFGGGQRNLDPQSYQLANFQQNGQQYQDLANRALGQQQQMRPMTPEEQTAERNRVMLEVAAGRLPPTALNSMQTQVAAGPMQQVAQPQDQFRGQQQGLADNLMGTITGTGGPSVAQQQLQQTTQGNIANAYAMAQSGRYNPAAARMAANNVGAINQQAAGQGALLRAQETQNSQGMLGNVLGGGRGQDIGQFQAQNQAAQGYLGQNLQMNEAQMQAQMAREQQAAQNFAGAQQNAIGGKILNAAAGVGAAFAGKAHGGVIEGKSEVGVMGNQICAGCGKLNSECECWKRSAGGLIPGQATGGDRRANDTVPTMLSPGEVVLPRSITLEDDAPEKAKLFVEAIQRKRGMRLAA